MISVEHVRLMARYNIWQNGSLYAAADGLGEAARRLDRGAFFGSIHGTLCHILWGDRIWMSRFAGWEKPAIGGKDSPGLIQDWNDLKAARREMDARLLNWAEALQPAWLEGELEWFSGATNRTLSRPRWMLVAHLFNHQTHHRGQAHAMLTAAGARPEDTDLPFMPGLG